MKKSILITSLIALCCNTAVLAEQTPQSISKDHRVKIVNYDSENVTLLNVHYGYATDITFDDDETVENISIGDSLAWQAVPVRNHLFIKPIASSNTNMTILTNLHNYNFQLNSSNSQNPYDQVYELKFVYPDDNLSAQSGVTSNPDSALNIDFSKCNWKYSFTGDKSIVPIQVFDDGQFTYFKFKKDGNSDTPAIYSVDKSKNESLVNYHVQNGYVVVNRVANQFTLRDGSLVTSIYNDDAIGDWQSIK